MYKTLTVLIFVFSPFLAAQTPFRVMCYNVENLFDTHDDPHTKDNEFLPSSGRKWTPGRFRHKIRQIAKVILAAGEWDPPAIIGLCEVENETVVNALLQKTSLRSLAYRCCLADGSDSRGIRQALLYRQNRFKYLGHRSEKVRSHRTGEVLHTRDIFHVYGKVLSGDTLDIFVCHFPSRYAGEKESEAGRMSAAHTLRGLCDSLMQRRARPSILIMGDFNDLPESQCLRLVAGKDFHNPFARRGKHSRPSPPGSHKYRGHWNQFDQILMHHRLLSEDAGIKAVPGSACTLNLPFLLTEENTRPGMRPFRTYYGYTYEGGFSDHLPVVADFLLILPQ